MLFSVKNKTDVSELPFKNEYDNVISCGDYTFILYKMVKLDYVNMRISSSI